MRKSQYWMRKSKYWMFLFHDFVTCILVPEGWEKGQSETTPTSAPVGRSVHWMVGVFSSGTSPCINQQHTSQTILTSFCVPVFFPNPDLLTRVSFKDFVT
jgi:hypothetical protein